jgi:hypothetical protein
MKCILLGTKRNKMHLVLFLYENSVAVAKFSSPTICSFSDEESSLEQSRDKQNYKCHLLFFYETKIYR